MPLSQAEEKLIFEGHRKFGNKWAEIAKLLNGRTDNVVKNFFYSTLRRQLRRVSRKMSGRRRHVPDEITLQYLRQVMQEHGVPYSELDNQNVREALELMDSTQNNADSVSNSSPSVNDASGGPQRYSLYPTPAHYTC